MSLRRRFVVSVLACTVLASSTACSGGEDFCDVAADYRAMLDTTGDQSMEDAAASWTETGKAMESTEAPDEIADDWDVVTATVVESGDIFTNGTDAEKVSDPVKLMLADEFQTAQGAVHDYIDASCGA